MKTYTAIILTLILITLLTATYMLYLNVSRPKAQEATYTESKVFNDDTQFGTVYPQNAAPTVEETPKVSKVSGKLCYPSEMLPAMDVYLKDVGTQKVTAIKTLANQQNFTFDTVAAGEYVAFAYLQNGGDMGGGYTKAVPCGLTASCTDHSLIEFTVVEGVDYANVDVCDWYGAEIPNKP